MTRSQTSALRANTDWLTLFACGVIAGTLVNAVLGIAFRLAATLVYQKTGTSGANYATWPLFYSFCSYAFTPRQIAIGAIAGLIASAVLCLKGTPFARWLLFGLVFTVAMFSADLLRHATPASATLALAGNIVRGTLLGYFADTLFTKWRVK